MEVLLDGPSKSLSSSPGDAWGEGLLAPKRKSSAFDDVDDKVSNGEDEVVAFDLFTPAVQKRRNSDVQAAQSELVAKVQQAEALLEEQQRQLQEYEQKTRQLQEQLQLEIAQREGVQTELRQEINALQQSLKDKSCALDRLEEDAGRCVDCCLGLLQPY